MDDLEFLLQSTIKLHHIIRNEVVAACEQASLEELSRVAVEAEGDTIYAVDQVSEELLYEFFVEEVAPQLPIVLIA
ncbi:inositol monophosphatase, partial [bacterium]|nr:inositol monophosphatase [bacterium]